MAKKLRSPLKTPHVLFRNSGNLAAGENRLDRQRAGAANVKTDQLFSAALFIRPATQGMLVGGWSE